MQQTSFRALDMQLEITARVGTKPVSVGHVEGKLGGAVSSAMVVFAAGNERGGDEQLAQCPGPDIAPIVSRSRRVSTAARILHPPRKLRVWRFRPGNAGAGVGIVPRFGFHVPGRVRTVLHESQCVALVVLPPVLRRAVHVGHIARLGIPDAVAEVFGIAVRDPG